MPRKNRRVRPPSFGEFVRAGIDDQSADRSVDFARFEIAEAISRPKFGILDDLRNRLESEGSEPRVIDAWAARWNIPRSVLELGVWVLCWGGIAGARWLERSWSDGDSAPTESPDDNRSDRVPSVGEAFWSGDFELRVESRDLTQNSLTELIQEIESRFKAEFEAWKASVERRVREERLRLTNPVGRTGQHLPNHYDWFVEFHCLGRTYADISGEGPLKKESAIKRDGAGKLPPATTASDNTV